MLTSSERGVPITEPPAPGPRLSIAAYDSLLARIGLAATGVLLFVAAADVAAYADLRQRTALLLIDFALYGAGFALLIAAATSRFAVRNAGAIVLIAMIFGFSVIYYGRIESDKRYGADIAVFSHVSAEMVLDGENPYAVRSQDFLVAQAERFNHPPFLITRLENGSVIDRLMVYPAGHVLVFVPLLALGVDDIRWVPAGAVLVVVGLLWWQAPAPFRPLIALPIIVDPVAVLIYPTGGVVDQIWLVPLMGAAIALNSRRYGWAALLYGLAASIKQLPWLLAPFLLVWLWHETASRPREERVKVIARFIVPSSAVFLAVNLPFMIWGFGDWFGAMTFHLRTPLQILGTGLSNLTGTGTLRLGRTFYSALSMVVLGGLFGAYLLWYGRLKHAVWVFPGIVLWFTYRSLQSYFVFWTPLLLVSILAWYRREGGAEALGGERVTDEI